ncbi:hypothetical protein FACS189459_1450 [Bacilli bacterium]|nr:hypothetical protein FACS189459_1450 [Bacilli bacterium]
MFQRVELQDKTIKVKTTGLKDISEKLDFLLKDFIKARGNSISITDSIFKLWEKWNSVSNSTRELC